MTSAGETASCPQGRDPVTYFNDGRVGDFFGFEILAKSDFFGSMKDARIFLGCEKNHLWDFFGYAKKSL